MEGKCSTLAAILTLWDAEELPPVLYLLNTTSYHCPICGLFTLDSTKIYLFFCKCSVLHHCFWFEHCYINSDDHFVGVLVDCVLGVLFVRDWNMVEFILVRYLLIMLFIRQNSIFQRVFFTRLMTYFLNLDRCIEALIIVLGAA